MKLLFVGDLHLRGQNPRNRRGSYYDDCFAKLSEIKDLSVLYNAPVVHTGDLFDSPMVSYSVFGALADYLSGFSPVWFAVPGNHDLIAHNLDKVSRTPFGALTKLGYVQADKVIGTSYEIRGVGFDPTLDRDLHEYKVTFLTDKCRVLVVHGMLLPQRPVFDKYSYVEDVAEVTQADVVLSGHYHSAFITEAKGKKFINPGAVMRINASEEEIKRMPHVVLFDTDNGKTEILPLKVAKPGDEVLDRSAIVLNNDRDAHMQEFLLSLDYTSESRFLNMQEIMEKIIKDEKLDPNITTIAMNKLSEVREASRERKSI